MICIRKDLIDKELERDIDIGFTYNKFNLHKGLINKLFNHYDLVEMCENFYDTEPEVDNEEFDMYLDYKENINMTGLTFWNLVSREEELKENQRFSKKEYTREELKAAYEKVKKIYEDYESERIEFNNWQEPYFKGNWGYTQNYVNIVGKSTLEGIRKSNFSKKDRLYISYKEDYIRIYYYGRDIKQVDYWFIFKRR